MADKEKDKLTATPQKVRASYDYAASSEWELTIHEGNWCICFRVVVNDIERNPPLWTVVHLTWKQVYHSL